MSRLITFYLIAMVTLLGAGCERTHPSEPSSTIHQIAVEPMTETRLETKIGHDELSLADRLWVTTTWHWSGDVVATLEDPEWGSSGWSVIETIHTEPIRDEQGYWAQRRILLEPFLPGEYTIPTGRLLIESSSLQESVKLELERPITVSVVGVLPETDSGTLSELAEPAVPPVIKTGSDTMLLLIVVTGAAIIAGGVAVYLRLKHEPTPPLSVHDQLVQIRDRHDMQRDHAFLLLERTFDRLDPRLRGTTEFAGMIRACEQARYAPESDTRTSPSRLAAFTLELLGHDRLSDAQEGRRA